MAQTSPRDVSTVLLVFPEVKLFGEDYAVFDKYSEALEDALGGEHPLQLDGYMNNVRGLAEGGLAGVVVSCLFVVWHRMCSTIHRHPS